ncbi:predicted protein [Plenodomus lingam JN3]|uniref:Uncharacterized protein n=1 Tax=Leptosphaeria maculans (strain JN3 / isolate v23.1.3 / race Av1-4-5-6-7-8) TaxID=985895 RepID=E4ZGW6_LEPMJ|nr:predicted protein [Plenodomus lingam JN3]CBX90536.1 predicted protein [Plenodomus lingam JN3]
MPRVFKHAVCNRVTRSMVCDDSHIKQVMDSESTQGYSHQIKNHTITTMLSDPFSDAAAIDMLEFENVEDGINPCPKHSDGNTAYRPEKVAVPILDAISSDTHWNSFFSRYSPDNPSTAPNTSPCTETTSPIQWTPTDLGTTLPTIHK